MIAYSVGNERQSDYNITNRRAMGGQNTYGIIGAGAIGQALASVVKRSSRQVLFWDLEPAKRSVQSLPELISKSRVIILAVPSGALRKILAEIKDSLNEDHVILTAAKGVEPKFVTMDKVLKSELPPKQNYGLMYGPMLAAEVFAGNGGYGFLATKKPAGDILADFKAGGLYLEQTGDVATVAACGTLKNIYALGLGVLDGVEAGTNAKGAMTVRMAAELAAVLGKLQLDRSLAYSQCGLGDLLATGWGSTSYNRRIGIEIGNGETDGLSGEGLNSLMEIPSALDITNFPILSSLHHITVNKAPAEQFCDIINQ